MAASLLAILFFQYLSWTPIGASFIDGVQGRYFLPLALMLPLMLPHLTKQAEESRAIIRMAVCLFPAVSIVITLHTIVWRYYL